MLSSLVGAIDNRGMAGYHLHEIKGREVADMYFQRYRVCRLPTYQGRRGSTLGGRRSHLGRSHETPRVVAGGTSDGTLCRMDERLRRTGATRQE